ncbi:MAG: TlpA family protein disulfide reductase [Bacteroidales bacterium]|nr:TlpA family protein disulfide reductase [Bacteroidales bacterium]
MKKLISVITLAMIAMTLTNGQEGDGSLLKVGDKAPLFTATTIDGKVIDLTTMKNKVIMITFFATWCGPCNLELPVLEKNVWNKYRDNSNFVLVVMGREHDAQTLKDFAASKNLNLPFAPDVKREVFAKYAEKNIPRNVIIGKDGKIAWQSTGYTEEEFSKLEQTLATLLK